MDCFQIQQIYKHYKTLNVKKEVWFKNTYNKTTEGCTDFT